MNRTHDGEIGEPPALFFPLTNKISQNLVSAPSRLYSSAAEVALHLQPSEPVHCLRLRSVSRITSWFVDSFKKEHD